MILLYYETINKLIDTCYLQSQVDIRIWDIRFALVSDNIILRIRIRIKIW
jgi:hypothetical protein